MVLAYRLRLANPLYWLTKPFVSKPICFTRKEQQIRSNCEALREKIRQYVRARRNGQNQSSFKDNSDLLSLFLEASDVFTEEDVIDEIVDFVVAGVQTTQFTTQTIIACLSTSPDALTKTREEFSQL